MNAVEIEEAVEELVGQPFDRGEFPFQFLTAFDNKDTTVRRLRSGSSNNSDVLGGVLQRSNIHIATCAAGAVEATLAALRASPRTEAQKAKFILATDGDVLQAEDLTSGEPLTCDYQTLHEHFAFFLPLAGISTVSEIKNNPIDIKATGRLNKLYVELLRDNADWGTPEKRPALNQFMARLIFCFFAEDTGIFRDGLFTTTIAQMSHAGHGSGNEQWGNTHEVLAELFRAMDTDTRHEGRLDGRHRKAAGIKSWADVFPYVNGGLFTGNIECPKFSRIARSYLLRAGELNWREINPDIFGSMIQAVADDDERGELGMHYTSVPNILKVLNPLFLDNLREQLEIADDNVRKLRNLRKRLGNIRVFDPACGSGNFLVIAYLKMREIENEIVQRTGDDPRSAIKLSSFYGIEIKSFAVEIARLSLLIAEFQADCRFINQHEARAMVLPLHRTGQIHVGNALRVDWQEVCPAEQQLLVEEDLAGSTGRLALDQSDTAQAETYVCGNPPYKGSQDQTPQQKEDLRSAFDDPDLSTGAADYVLGWFAKARAYIRGTDNGFAFVATNSIHQGRQVARFWPTILGSDLEIFFAEPSFRWSNLAKNKAVVTVSVIGIMRRGLRNKVLYEETLSKKVAFIGPYLVPDSDVVVGEERMPLADLPPMVFGSMANDGGHFILDFADRAKALQAGVPHDWIRPFMGTNELTKGLARYCIWLRQISRDDWIDQPFVKDRVCSVMRNRVKSSRPTTRKLARKPHLFGEVRQIGNEKVVCVSRVSSETREYLPVTLYPKGSIVSDAAYGMFDAPLWVMAIVASRLHLVWAATVCGKMKTDYRYSNTLGWNTFPLPNLRESDRAELAKAAEGILVTREAHFPKTIADLYEPEDMPEDLRHAHEVNDEILERIYIGRRFRNDTERLEKLLELYSRMTADKGANQAA